MRGTSGSINIGRFTHFLKEGLDLLFPPACLVCSTHEEIEPDGMICRPCFGEIFQPASVPSAFPLWTAGGYAGPLRELIHRAKFSADPLPLSTLVLLLERTVRARIEIPIDVVTSVPASPKRLRARGLDLPGTLARRLSRKLGVPHSRTVIRRTQETEAQTSLSREERLMNLSGVFSTAENIPEGHILVLDDVVTTGATAAAILEAFPPGKRADVRFLAVARTPEVSP